LRQWAWWPVERTARIEYGLQAGERVPVKTREGRRTVPLHGDVMAALQMQRSRQVFQHRVMRTVWRGTDDPRDGYIFTNTFGGPLIGAEVTRQFQALLAEAGLPRCRWHDLRHMAASLMLASGSDITTVSRLLGHSTITVTADYYTEVLPQVMREAAERMGSLLRARPAG
jgi:integrase